jgi:hypothetical protein
MFSKVILSTYSGTVVGLPSEPITIAPDSWQVTFETWMLELLPLIDIQSWKASSQ